MGFRGRGFRSGAGPVLAMPKPSLACSRPRQRTLLDDRPGKASTALTIAVLYKPQGDPCMHGCRCLAMRTCSALLVLVRLLEQFEGTLFRGPMFNGASISAALLMFCRCAGSGTSER